MLFIHVALIKPTAINPFFRGRDPWHRGGIKAHAFQRAALRSRQSATASLHPVASASGANEHGGELLLCPSHIQLLDGLLLLSVPVCPCATSLPAAAVRYWAPMNHTALGIPSLGLSPPLVAGWVLCAAASVGTGEPTALEVPVQTCGRVQLLQNDVFFVPSLL